jgi:hypothetical protein
VQGATHTLTRIMTWKFGHEFWVIKNRKSNG